MNSVLRFFSSGPTLVATAALLWATDALLRNPLAPLLPSTDLVLGEHVLALAILLPVVIVRYRHSLWNMQPREWVAAAFNGVCGSALALIFFTESFLYTSASVAILLQKLQPVMVVLIAFVILKERPQRSFYLWATMAFVAGLVLSFPDLDFAGLMRETPEAKGMLYALGASFLWASATVSGRYLLRGTPTPVALFWRFFFGFCALLLFGSMATLYNQIPLWSSSSLMYFFLLSLLPGLGGMWIYYAGLAKTSASITTVIELIYPILAVILNAIFLDMPLTMIQIAAGAVLTFAISRISH